MNFNLKDNLDGDLKTELEEYDARIEAEIEERHRNTDAKHKKADKTFIRVFWAIFVIGLIICFASIL